MMQSRKRLLLFWSLKISVFIASCIYIFYHINNRVSLLDDGERLWNSFADSDSQKWIIACLLFMIFNWTLEIIKWQRLIAPVEPISFVKAGRSVLTGITVSFFTPNRVGEFAGRILHLDEGYRIRGILSAFIGSTAQLLITLQFGLIAVACSVNEYYPIEKSLQYPLQFLLFLSVPVLLVAWIKVPRIALLFEHISWLKKYRKYSEVFKHYHARDLLITYLISLFRYIIFCTQQYFLFRAFQVDVGYILCMKLSALSFLIITIVPSIAFAELGIRGGINLAIFGAITTDTPAILLVTFVLWTINLAIPALMGAVSMLYIRIKKN